MGVSSPMENLFVHIPATPTDAGSSQSPAERNLVPSEEVNMAKLNNPIMSSAVLRKPKETVQENVILVRSSNLEPATTTRLENRLEGTSRTPPIATIGPTPAATAAVPTTSVVTTSFVTSSVKTSTTVTTNSAEPRRKVSLPPALQKDQSFEENWVKVSLEVNTEESTSVAMKPKSIDGNLPAEAPEIKSSSETSRDQPGRSADSINAGPKTRAGEIISSSKVTVIEVEQEQAGAVMNRDGSGSGAEAAQSQSLREDPRGAHELHIRSPRGPESSPKLFALSSMEKMKKQTPPPASAVQRTEEEIIVSGFKRTSPTRMDELDVSPGVPGSSADLNTLLEQIGAENKDHETETESTNTGPESKGRFAVDLKDPVDTETVELVLVSKEAGKIDEVPLAEEEPRLSDTEEAPKVELRPESDILASVYARALRAKPLVSKNISLQDPTQQKVEDEVPSILIESPQSKEMESKHFLWLVKLIKSFAALV